MSLHFVEERPVSGRVLPLEAGNTLGREACEIVLPDPEVSRRHAALRAAGEDIAIEDLDSLNGTFVNDRRIDQPTVLAAGDTVRLGNTVLRVED